MNFDGKMEFEREEFQRTTKLSIEQQTYMKNCLELYLDDGSVVFPSFDDCVANGVFAN